MAKDPDIKRRMDRIEEVIDQLDAGACCLMREESSQTRAKNCSTRFEPGSIRPKKRF
jgi:hypothetical protein